MSNFLCVFLSSPIYIILFPFNLFAWYYISRAVFPNLNMDGTEEMPTKVTADELSY